jgi:hypothetical protein
VRRIQYSNGWTYSAPVARAAVVAQFENPPRLRPSGVIPKSRAFTSGTRDLPRTEAAPSRTELPLGRLR